MKTEDFKYYFFLSLVLMVGVGAFLFFDYNRYAQTLIVLSMATAYFFWGLIHHLQKKDLYLKVAIEYALIAIMASTLVVFLLWRA